MTDDTICADCDAAACRYGGCQGRRPRNRIMPAGRIETSRGTGALPIGTSSPDPNSTASPDPAR